MITFLRIFATLIFITATGITLGACGETSVPSYKTVSTGVSFLEAQQRSKKLGFADIISKPIHIVSAHADSRGGVVLGVVWYLEANQAQEEANWFWRQIRHRPASEQFSLNQDGQEVPLEDYSIRSNDFGGGFSISDVLPYPLSLPPSGENPIFHVIIHPNVDGTFTHAAVRDLRTKHPLAEGKLKVTCKPSLLQKWGYQLDKPIEFEIDVVRID